MYLSLGVTINWSAIAFGNFTTSTGLQSSLVNEMQSVEVVRLLSKELSLAIATKTVNSTSYIINVK